MEEVEGQAQAASEDQLAHQAALRILDSEEPKETAQEETQAATEEPQETTETQEEAKEETQETPEPSITFKLKVKKEDGGEEEVEVGPEDLKKGYMMERDYRAKTAQLAREREAVQARIREQVEPKLNEYAQQLETYKAAVLKLADQEAIAADLNKLAEQDPAKAQQLFFKRLEINNTLTAIAAEQQKLMEARQIEFQQAQQKQIQEAVSVLQDPAKGIPGWNNDLYSKVLQAGVDNGLKQEVVTAITDPAAIKVLWKAMQYDALQKAKPAVEKKVATVPKVSKPGTAEKPDPKANQWSEGMARLRKTGKDADAIAIAKLLIQ